MHVGRSYTLSEFLFWTRRTIFWLFGISLVATALYEIVGLKWLAIPWSVIALHGTVTAFIIGFKNIQTYNRTWEARQIWGSCMSASRAWGVMCRDYIKDSDEVRGLVYRHFAWLTALRYQLRAQRGWETMQRPYNAEYSHLIYVDENHTPLETELAKYISESEIKSIWNTSNRAAQLLSLQGTAVRELHDEGFLSEFGFLEVHRALQNMYEHQGKSERIKNFPFPRQYATVAELLVKIFCVLLPFCMLAEFDKMNVVWLVVPFSVLISWVFTSLEQVGESTENPFEGNANDVPITQMSRAVEIDMREMLGETNLPEQLMPKNNIIT